MKKPRDWYVVADGGRARFLTRREDTVAFDTFLELNAPSLHAPARHLGTDRPGRAHESASSTRHAIQPRMDPHQVAKRDFVREVARIANEAGAHGEYDRLFIAAPPRVLAELLDDLEVNADWRLGGILRKDLTHVPEADLASHLEDMKMP
ncbi:MAG: hypothetical protein GC201_11495 [Alphaproteobacteria bacterium]|nr:hypothetical protein [Alphaproteobacteria bacterium]